jgi:glutamyl-tRNA synthetase
MVVTRFAPSPTGSLHIGGIRTALFAYALARRHNGRFFLRIEDTDQNRFVEGAEAEIEEMLDIYGLSYDEKFKQSERLEVYKQEAEKLIEQGDAYYCFATKQEIDEMRAKAQEQKETFIFRSPAR